MNQMSTKAAHPSSSADGQGQGDHPTPTADLDGADESEIMAGIFRGVLRGKRAAVKATGQHGKGLAKGTRGAPWSTTVAKGGARQSKAVAKGGARQATRVTTQHGSNLVKGKLQGAHVSKVARVADRIDNTVGALDAVTEAAPRKSVAKRQTWFSRAIATVKQASPSFVREAILGSALFGVYEASTDAMMSALDRGGEDDGHPAEDVTVRAAVALGAGWSGGFIYGTLQQAVDAAILRRMKLPHAPPAQWMRQAGRTSGLTYGATFMTYELIKCGLLTQTNPSPSDSGVQLVCVGLSGAVAGVVNTAADSWCGLQPRMTVWSVIKAVPTGAITFIAFEYGKEIIEDSDSKGCDNRTQLD
jgi:hypothetical protein